MADQTAQDEPKQSVWVAHRPAADKERECGSDFMGE
jgi:hypothetical protein